MPPKTEPETHWFTVDRKVNVAFIAAMIAQTIIIVAAGATYASKVDSRLQALETTDTRLVLERDARRVLIDGRLDFLIKDRDRLVRVETQIEEMKRILIRMEQRTEREMGGGR